MNSKKIMPFGVCGNRRAVDSIQIAEKRHHLSRYRRKKNTDPFKLLCFLCCFIPLSGCGDKPAKPVRPLSQFQPAKHPDGLKRSRLDRVKQAGELKIVTVYSPSAYFEGPDGPAGLEHDLAELFAQRLGVKARFIVPKSVRQVTRMVESGNADFAAAGLMVTEARKRRMRFAPAYRRTTEQVVYRADHAKPHYVTDLSNGILEVGAGASHVETLQSLRRRYPDLSWNINFEQNAEGLLYLVSEGLLDYTIVQSDQMLRMRRFYPNLQVAFDVGKPRDLAWAFAQGEDSSLYDEAVRFFEEIKQNKLLDQLIDRYYGHSASYDAALDSSLRVHYQKRLPKYKRLFQKAAEQQGIDWRLLAAQAYQESQWDGKAVSAEGVQGMMQLTGVTARELNVTNRFDPGQSIRAGAAYLRETLAHMPEHIQDPDRTWLALAAYNVGWGHIEDARRLVRERGGDPDKWIDVKGVLPLLGKKSWYRKTRHGRARGALAVHYVNSIRRFYDLLVWLTEDEETRKLAMGLGKGRAADRAS
jgi:membrane-bound lytic murein transglycosylase F